jgi:hypothetical protein
VPVDETPTLVDLASRRAMRDAARDSGRKGRSRRRKSDDKDFVDEEYWAKLRGEAQ